MTEKLVVKPLRYDFTEAETRVNAKELARQNRALVEAEMKRKQVTSDLKADEQRITSDIGKLSRFVNDGYDYREVECRVVFNDPRNGLKTIYRTDTGESVETINMEQFEMQENLPLGDPETDNDEEDGEEMDTSGDRRPY